MISSLITSLRRERPEIVVQGVEARSRDVDFEAGFRPWRLIDGW